MTYPKTTWVDGVAPALSATNLNKIETGIESYAGVEHSHPHSVPVTGYPTGVNFVLNAPVAPWANNGGNQPVDNIFYLPCMFAMPCKVSHLGIWVAGMAAAWNVRLGLYDGDGTGGLAGTLLGDFGVLAIAAGGAAMKAAASPVSVQGGRPYWAAMTTDSAWNGSGNWWWTMSGSSHMWRPMTNNWSQSDNWMSSTSTYPPANALPATASISLNSGWAAPFMLFRCAP